MKELKINVPEGYEIDKDKSTFENIVFKPIVKSFPKTWKELEKISGYYVSRESLVHNIDNSFTNTSGAKNIFATGEQAQASIALAQLSQLMKVYNGGWEPDWSDNKQNKYVIFCNRNDLSVDCNWVTKRFLTFKDAQTRDLFLENFKDLIEQAKPLL